MKTTSQIGNAKTHIGNMLLISLRVRAFTGFADFLRRYRAKSEAEHCPAVGVGFGRDLATMRLNDGARDRQPNSIPFALVVMKG